MKLGKDISPHSISHEFGHLIEDLTIGGDAIKEFYKDESKFQSRSRITTHSGRLRSHDDDAKREEERMEVYHNLSFEYPENAAYKQYVAKFYPDGHTELLSSFFEYLSIDARHLLTHNKYYVSKMLDALMKRMEDK